jgi:hypothetical protein
MIELRITKTCMFSTTGENAGWRRYDDGSPRKAFPDMKAAQAWLREEYGKARRRGMYRDVPNGPPIRCGYVIGFRPRYREQGSPIAEQHWVEFRSCEPVNLGRHA